jgi:hypothetical protein
LGRESRSFRYWREILRAIWSATIANSYAYRQSVSHSDGNAYFNANSNSYGYSHSQSNPNWNADRNPYWDTDNNSNPE